MKAFREDQKQRINEANEARARADAAGKAARMARAQVQLPTRVDTDAAAARLRRYREDSLRAFLAHFCLFVLLPTFVVGAYLFAVATPLYEARTHLLVVRDQPTIATNSAGIFGTIRSPNGAADLVDTLLGTDAMFAALNDTTGFASKLASSDVDAITRFDPQRFWAPGREAQLRRFVSVNVNSSNDMATLSVRMPDPNLSLAVSAAALTHMRQSMDSLALTVPNSAALIIQPIAPASVSDTPIFPRKLRGVVTAFIAFGCAFFVGRVILASLALGRR